LFRLLFRLLAAALTDESAGLSKSSVTPFMLPEYRSGRESPNHQFQPPFIARS